MRFHWNPDCSHVLQGVLATIVVSIAGPLACAQVVPEYEGHTPLSQWQTPGTAAGMAQMAGRADPTWFQPLRILVEDGGEVTVFHSHPATPFKQASPAQFGVLVGHLYRLKIEGIPGLPGITLYPTIEVVDRLHPPPGQKHNFPVLIHIDRRDIDQALVGNLVTRVVYLEQPTIAAPFELDRSTRTRNLDRMDNALLQADRYGRPMVIVRLGGRLPSPHGESQRFWGTGGPVSLSKPDPDAAGKGQSEPQAVHEAGTRLPRHSVLSGRREPGSSFQNSQSAAGVLRGQPARPEEAAQFEEAAQR